MGLSTASMIRICALADIADGKGAEFDVELGGVRRYLYAVRSGDAVAVYLDYCPHMGYPEKFVDLRFLMSYSKKVHCAVHGARFDPADGRCLAGPPSGDYLGRFESRIVDGDVYVDQTLTWPGRDAVLAKRQALIDAYLAQQKAREDQEKGNA